MKEKALYLAIGALVGVVLAPKLRQLPLVSRLPAVG